MLGALVLIAAAPARGQAVSQWKTAGGIPVAVVETPGGDVEHLAALIPPGARPPATVGGFPAASAPAFGAQAVTATVPAMMAVLAAQELVAGMGPSGGASVVAVGPVPARELRGALAGLDQVTLRPPAPGACVVADGTTALVRGGPERVELTLAAPEPADPRFAQLPALAELLRVRLAKAFPGSRTGADLASGCSHIVITVAAGRDEPLALARRLRDTLATLPATPPSVEEVATIQAQLQRRAVAWAADGAGTARSLAERLALGGSAAAALVPPTVDSASLGALLHVVVDGHMGAVTAVEQERRDSPETGRTLDNGVTASWRWVPGDVAVVGVALGGVTPEAGRAVLESVAGAASSRGWTAQVLDLAGVPAAAVAAPQDDVSAVLELVSDSLTAAPAAPARGLMAPVDHALGLSPLVSADGVSVAMSLPMGADEAVEAVSKFFSALPVPGVRSGVPSAPATLSWTPGPPPTRLAALVELPVGLDGLVAGSILAARLGADAGARCGWLAPPGRLVLLVEAGGEGTVPALDEGLAKQWKRLTRPAAKDEVASAARTLTDAFYGDLLQSTARRAAAPFLPVVPPPAGALMGADAKAIDAVLKGLPPWDQLARFGAGPGPAPAGTAPAGVRQSPPRPPGA